MINTNEDVKRAVSDFVKSCSRNYEFPAGGTTVFLTQSEEALCSALHSTNMSDTEKVLVLSAGLDWSECYLIVVFGIRLAVLAVRNANPATYKLGVLALVAGSPLVDWRDVLRALAIFENCGNHLGVRFQEVISTVAMCADDKKLRSTFDSYFSRTDDMRSIEVMGVVESGSGNHLMFKSR